MSFKQFVRKSWAFVQNCGNGSFGFLYNILINLLITGLLALCVGGGFFFTYAFMIAAACIDTWTKSREKSPQPSIGSSILFTAYLALVMLVLSPIILGIGVIAAGVIAAGLNLFLPFMGFAIGFKRGSLAAMLPAIIPFCVTAAAYRANRKNAAVRNQNMRLHNQISKLPSPPSEFLFLNADEIERLSKVPEAKEALERYTQALESINRDARCTFSLHGVQEMNPCTIEYNEGKGRHYKSYNTEDFLNFINRLQGRYVYLTDSRIGINGLGVREEGDKKPDPRYTNPEHYAFTLTQNKKITETYLFNKNGFKIYKGFHPEVLARLRNELGPSLNTLRGILENPISAALIESKAVVTLSEVEEAKPTLVQADPKAAVPQMDSATSKPKIPPRNWERLGFTAEGRRLPQTQPGQLPQAPSLSRRNSATG